MLMRQVRDKTGLTRKAIEYYEEKGFISPRREENNYRVYTDDDLKILRKITIYRKLGCSIQEIKKILEGKDKLQLDNIIRDREIKSQLDNTRVEALKLLLKDSSSDVIQEKLDSINRQETIYSRLSRAFPGYFGQIFFLSYKDFLNDKLDKDNFKYYKEYIYFLDNMPELELDEDEKNALEEVSQYISKSDIEKANKDKMKAIDETDEWLEENKEMIERFESFKESELYKNNPVYKIQEKLKKYMEESDYYKIAIPLMRKFSPSYDEYYKKLLKANEKFLGRQDKN